MLDFLKHKKKKPKTGPNKKGRGFSFLRVAAREDVFGIVRSRRSRIGFLTAACALVFYISMVRMNGENAFLVLAVLGVGALVAYDITTRRQWEKTVTDQLQALGRNHDRLVREVARNRADISVVKEGLFDAAAMVQDMGKNHGPSRSIEARMIETIITQLSTLGQKPRAIITEDTEHSANMQDPLDGILQLEMAPPARLPKTPTQLESELAPDFSKFSDTVVLELIRHAVRHDKLDVFVQPVVSLPQRKMRMYEVFARLRANAGTYIPAARYLEIAQRESMVTAIDNLLLLRCLQILRDRRNDEMDIPYILNITSATFHDTGFMNDLVSFLAQYRNLAMRIIFELPLEDIENANIVLNDVLDGLSQLGCRFSVDQVRKRKIDINMLKSRHVRFLKIDAGWLLREAQQEGGQSRVLRLKKQMDKSGLDLIVEKIERENELRELLDYGIDYGQGYLFGKPDLHAVYYSRERREAYA